MNTKKTWLKAAITVHSIEGGYLWTSVITTYYDEDSIVASFGSTEPIKNEGRARLEALKWILGYLNDENDVNTNLILNCRRGNTYEKYTHYVITQSIKWWVDHWHVKDGSVCKNIDLLKEIVPLLVKCFDRVKTTLHN